MTDPLTVAIAAALAGKAVELVGEPAKQAVAAIVRKVRDKFRGRPDDEAALTAVAVEPDSPERLAAFDAALRQAIADDPAFGAELRALWRQAQGGAVTNIVSGRADKSVQLRDVHGDLTIN
jgi:hypothetical protein